VVVVVVVVVCCWWVESALYRDCCAHVTTLPHIRLKQGSLWRNPRRSANLKLKMRQLGTACLQTGDQAVGCWGLRACLDSRSLGNLRHLACNLYGAPYKKLLRISPSRPKMTITVFFPHFAHSLSLRRGSGLLAFSEWSLVKPAHHQFKIHG
jgi:hypothetical protein